MKVLDGSLSYEGYKRSAQTAGINVTKPAPLEGGSAGAAAAKVGSGTITGATIPKDATGTDLVPAKDEKVTLNATYTDDAGTTQTVKFEVTGDGTKKLSELFAKPVKGDKSGWSAEIDADGKITVTSTNNMKADATTPNPALTFTTDGASTMPTVGGAAALNAVADESALDPGVKGKGEFDLAGTVTTGMTAGTTKVEIEITLANGKKGTVEGKTAVTAASDTDGTVTAASLDGAEITIDNVKYGIKATGAKIELTAKDAADQDLTGATVKVTTANTASQPTSNAVSNVTAGKAAEAPKDATGADETMPESTVKREGNWTMEFDTVKMRAGDTFTFTDKDGNEVDVAYEAGMSANDFANKVAEELGLEDGAAKGNAIITDFEVKATLSEENWGDPSKDSNAMMIQVGALEKEQLAISIDAMNTEGLKLDNITLDDQTLAGKAITAVRNAINKVSDQRATLGAMQNRLDHKIANLKVSSENLSAAESRIRDVDMASEMTNFTKNNILSQAATAMLAQANSLPQNVLSLLG